MHETNTPTTAAEADPRTALAGAAVASARDFTATYLLDSRTRLDATVRILHSGRLWRIDVDQGVTASRLLLGPDGAIACRVAPANDSGSACLLVAQFRQPLPALFDPGIQRIFTTTLRALATAKQLNVNELSALPASGQLKPAPCYRVSGAGIESGEYCLTDDGVLRRINFASGMLDLRAYGGPPPVEAFVPPATPTPLPQ